MTFQLENVQTNVEYPHFDTVLTPTPLKNPGYAYDIALTLSLFLRHDA